MYMRKITENVFQVGDSGCSVYLVHSSGIYALIDIGMDFDQIKNIESRGISFNSVEYCILTHCHIDHIHASASLKKYSPSTKLIAHELDSEPIEHAGFEGRTAVSWYNVEFII